MPERSPAVSTSHRSSRHPCSARLQRDREVQTTKLASGSIRPIRLHVRVLWIRDVQSVPLTHPESVSLQCLSSNSKRPTSKRAVALSVTIHPHLTNPPPPTSRTRARPRTVRRIVGPLIVLILWQVVCSAGVFTSFEVASPIAGFWTLVGEPRRPGRTTTKPVDLASAQCSKDWVLGVASASRLAVLSGLFRAGEDLLDPVVPGGSRGYDSWPGSVGDHLFGVGEMPKIFLIALVQRSRSI